MILLTKHNFGLQCLQVLWPTGRVSPDMVSQYRQGTAQWFSRYSQLPQAGSLKNKTVNTGIFKLIEQLLDNRPVDQVLHHVLHDHQLLLIGTQAHQHQGSSRGLRNPETIIL